MKIVIHQSIYLDSGEKSQEILTKDDWLAGKAKRCGMRSCWCSFGPPEEYEIPDALWWKYRETARDAEVVAVMVGDLIQDQMLGRARKLTA